MNEPTAEETIFAGAMRLAPEERDAYLDQACHGDAVLRQRLARLLNSYNEAGGFLDEPAAPIITQTRGPVLPLAEKPGDKIGRYKLLEQIGEGGCGVVYMAEQEEPVQRRVALKVIKLGMDTKSVIARFEAERQALALMDHPNIARVLDAGATETGRPYFVMELVRGVKITDYCDENNLTTGERLELFIQVCRAIQHAHQKGVIHRDIKPSNILVTLHDGLPVPKVIDFGIAKATQGRLTDRTLFTAFEQFIGTPAYMSPEQAEMSGLDIDTRSDIYSLGVLLYELLTSKTPFESKNLLAAGLDAMRRTIREREPERPSTRLGAMLKEELTTTAAHRRIEAPKLLNAIRGDLDWIVMKCLEKDRTRRYETANGLASDLQRHLSHEPVLACPPSKLYQFTKLVRRNKLAFAAGISVVGALVIGLGVATWMFFQERAALRRAVAAEREQTRLRQQAQAGERKAQSEAAKSKQVTLFLKEMLDGVGPSAALGRDTTLLKEVLDKTAERVGDGLKDQPAVEAELRSMIGEVYFAIGQWEKAEAMHREALALRRSLFGNNNLVVANSLHNLAVVLRKEVRAPEAEPFAREALAVRRRILGNEDLAVAESLSDLGNVLRDRGYDTIGFLAREAEACLREALSMRRKLLGVENLDVASSLHNLAGSLMGQDPEAVDRKAKLAESEALYREAISMRKKLLGDEHPDVAWSLRDLAAVLSKQNKPAEAEPIARQALAMRSKLLPPGHPQVGDSIVHLCRTLQALGKWDEAEALYRESLAAQRTVPGSENSNVPMLLCHLALLLERRGNLPEAECALREALEMGRRANRSETFNVETTANLLGNLLVREHKLAEAESCYRESAAISRKLSASGSLRAALENLASTLQKEAKVAEAQEVCHELLSCYRRSAEDGDIDALNADAWLLATTGFAALRDGPSAVPLAEKAVAATGRKSAKYLDTLAAAYAETGDFAKAISVQNEAIALLQDEEMKQDLASRLKLYQSNTPYREH
jgi:serine/threonine protein kinase